MSFCDATAHGVKSLSDGRSGDGLIHGCRVTDDHVKVACNEGLASSAVVSCFRFRLPVGISSHDWYRLPEPADFFSYDLRSKVKVIDELVTRRFCRTASDLLAAV